ncbi:MAG TPA: methyltransferase [Candidatus Hydrogenedentes bacterium]|nr:methyltransferase [Candidatus Hydrogenedentota bacterium]
MDDLHQLREWTGYINTIINGYKKSRILFTALNADVFEFLETEISAVELAAAAGWSERGAVMLLDGLLAMNLVEKHEGRYQNSPMARQCLMAGGAAYQGNILRHNMSAWNAWENLEERVRTGTCAPRAERRTGEALRNFILGMSNIAQLSAREVLETMDLSIYTHLLDLGGGPATYAITFLQAHAQMKATLFDQPEVVDIAREQVASAGLDRRFNYIAGNCLSDSMGNGYDLVFISNLIHSFSDEENGTLVKKAYDALVPGGTLIIKDFIVENDRSGPPYSLIFALQMLVHTPGGNTYTYHEIQGWTDAAGFGPGKAISLTPQTRMWIAQKPA